MEGEDVSTSKKYGIWKELSYPNMWQLLRDTSMDIGESSVPPEKSAQEFQSLVQEVKKAAPHSTLLVFGDKDGLVVSDMARVMPEDTTIVSMLQSEAELKEHHKNNRRDRVVTAVAGLNLETAESLSRSLFWSQYVIVLNTSSIFKGMMPKDVERILASFVLTTERLVIKLSKNDRSLKPWHNDPRALLRSVIARARLKSASVYDLDEDAGLFMVLTSHVSRMVQPFGVDGPLLTLEYNVAQKNRLPTRFPVLLLGPKDDQGQPGKAVPLDVFGISLQVLLNVLRVTHFSRRQLFERFSMAVPTRFLSFKSRDDAAEVPLSSFAQKAFSVDSVWQTNETISSASASLNARDIWICGDKLVYDPTLSKVPLGKKEQHSPSPTSRKLLAVTEEEVMRKFVFEFFFFFFCCPKKQKRRMRQRRLKSKPS